MADDSEEPIYLPASRVNIRWKSFPPNSPATDSTKHTTSMSVFQSGSTALITGAASGIGLALARHCRSCGMNVILADSNVEALAAAEKEVRASGEESKGEVIAQTVDVSKLDDWQALLALVKEKVGTVELLALNAGRGISGRSWGDDEYFRETLETNLFGVINGVNTFLPVVKDAAKEKKTAIIITGSKQGITNPPGNPAYNASKAAVRSLAEGLDWELRDSPTSVHLLVPGWTFTGMTRKFPDAEKPDGAWTPQQVVDFLLEKMEDGKFYVICPDNDVTEEMDKKRMLYAASEIVHGKPPLSRWREDTKVEAQDAINTTKV